MDQFAAGPGSLGKEFSLLNNTSIIPESSESPSKEKSNGSLVSLRAGIATDMLLRSAKEAGALGFYPHYLCLVTLPHSKPVDEHGREEREYYGVNGRVNLAIQAGPSRMPGAGIPYGMMPRLIMLRICSIVVHQKRQEKDGNIISLGASLSDFMRVLGLSIQSKNRKAITDQFLRLLTSRIQTWEGNGIHAAGIEITQIAWADRIAAWWKPRVNAALPNRIELNLSAYRDMVEHGIPVDLRGLDDPQIKKSPLGFDLYVWIPWRAQSVLHTGIQAIIPWASLLMQFGAGFDNDPNGIKRFKQMCRKYLKIIKKYYSWVDIDDSGPTVIILDVIE